MRLQPNRNYVSNDDIQTPPLLARRLVRHFRPRGRILEPCKGDGNFLKHLPKSAAWCEIKGGRNFFAWTQKVDWIITNPPWSQMRRFLQQAMSVADQVVFLISLARGMRSWPVESAAACEVPGYFTGPWPVKPVLASLGLFQQACFTGLFHRASFPLFRRSVILRRP